jgi:predicted ATPase/class 3 adenylate cyclase
LGRKTPPSGTVTFLFTDIEGSTWLVQHLGGDWDGVLHEHYRLLREAWDAHNGYEVSTEGDAFFVSFDEPDMAIGAAVAAQRALASHPWPQGSMRARIGIHTGEARMYGDNYVGLAVHQAARVKSAAHGGQIIVSDATHAAAGERAVSFVDLGPHRLKDLARPMRLYQVNAPGLESEFPPPKTLSVMPNNFPIQLTTFVGREDEIADLRAVLDENRLVTITGAGGVGKTRLALQVGAELLDDLPEGAWLADLSPLSDPDVVPAAVAEAVGVREQPGRDITRTLADQLVEKRLLIVLDNCEHLIDACAQLVHALLTSCRYLKVLATSREALNVPGEIARRLPSLAIPEVGRHIDLDSSAHVGSVQLFVQRAQAVRPGFDLTVENSDAIVQICRRLDGLPLALELAGARVTVMTVQELAARIDDRFRLLTGGSRLALPRQRTLEATVSWSYDLLTEPERLLFDRLSMFAGGCTLDAAEHVCTDETLGAAEVIDLLSRLVDRSLVVADQGTEGRTRYRMLDTLRSFGRERLLARGEMDRLRDRHLAWAVDLAARAPRDTGHRLPVELEAEVDNLRIAIEWAVDSGDLPSGLMILAEGVMFGSWDERERWFTELLPAGEEVDPHVFRKALFAAGNVSFATGRWEVGWERYRAAGDIARRIGNEAAVALALSREAACRWGGGAEDDAQALFDESLATARRSGARHAMVSTLIFGAWFESGREVSRAEALALEADALARRDGTGWERAHAREVLGFVHCLKGEYSRAGQTLAEATPLFAKYAWRGCSTHFLNAAATWAAMTERYELGAQLCGAAHRVFEETGDRPTPWEERIQERWLPRIRQELDDDSFEAARLRGMQSSYEETMALAERALRAP